jgi:UDP-N-acetylmuramoyl-tripeptide--D-alanyl-D-alanine ligase
MTDNVALWTSADLTQALGISDAGDWQASGVSIDTRTLKPGDIYVALKGENFDGADFIAGALEAGAVVALAERAPEEVDAARVIVVEDAYKALEQLGSARRAQTKAKVIAVTGSVGKTSVKEALRQLLVKQGKVHATMGNLNNHIGLPLTLARMPIDADFAVLEMGMNHAGELSELTQLGKPDAAIVTNVEAVHLEFFDSVEAIAHAKAEIFEGVKEGGTVIINADNPHAPILKEKAAVLGISKVLAFGHGEAADYQLLETTPTPEGLKVTVRAKIEPLSFTLHTLGEHQALNAAGVLAVIEVLGGDIKQAAADMASLKVSKGRGQIYPLHINGKDITLIDDSYNASPVSMRAGIAMLARAGETFKGRTIACLGNMLELGNDSPALHASMKDAIEEYNIDKVFTSGALMEHLASALPEAVKGTHTAKALELVGVLKNAIEQGDILLVKGSHGSHMWKLAEALIHEGTTTKG